MTAHAQSGNLLWGSRFGGKVATSLVAVLDRRSRAILVAGRADADPIDLGTGPLPAADGEIFVAALPRCARRSIGGANAFPNASGILPRYTS
jgi:hypothetical protein